MIPQSILITQSVPEERYIEAVAKASEILGENCEKSSDVRIFGNDNEKMGINLIREIKSWVSIAAGINPKIVILHHAESLTTEAQNAMLKVLEEPPERTFFILTAPSKMSLLPTVASRVLEYQVKRAGDYQSKITLTEILAWDLSERLNKIDEYKKDLTDSTTPIMDFLSFLSSQCLAQLVKDISNPIWLKVGEAVLKAEKKAVSGKADRQLILEIMMLEIPNKTTNHKK